MTDNHLWREAEQQILDALDIAAEYRALGVQPASDHPSSSGWLAVHAAGRDDRNPSASIHVGPGRLRGRYKDHGQDGITCNLWEFGARFGHFEDWRAARKHFAEKTGVKLPQGGEPRRPQDQLAFLDVDENSLAAWAGLKGGFDLAAIRDQGGVGANYPKKADASHAQAVAAFPAYTGASYADDEPCAWVIANQTGQDLQVYRGKGRSAGTAKTLSVGGSVGGMLGQYALRRLAEAAAGGPPVEVVWKVEGLSDLLALHWAITQAGYRGRHVVVSNSQGSLETVKPEWVALLRGQTVYTVHDADRPGRVGCFRWCHSLAGQAQEVRAVLLPYEVKDHHGEDVRDYLHRDGHGYQELLELARQAAPLTGAQPEALEALQGQLCPSGMHPLLRAAGPAVANYSHAQERAWSDLLDLLGLDILGEYRPSGEVDGYSRFLRKVIRIPEVRRYNRSRLIQDCGVAGRIYVHDGPGEVPGMRSIAEVREAISWRAGQTGLDATPPLGQGCWAAEGGVLLVNGCEAALYKDGRLQPITSPRLGRHILDFGGGDPWVDLKVLEQYLAEAGSLIWVRETMRRVTRLFRPWNWRHAVDATVAAALAACSWVQALWQWRPEVAISGSSDSGKTSFVQHTLAKLYGDLAWYSLKPSEAGVRQHIGHHARVLLLDEFESDAHRQGILAMFRVTSQGGAVHRGSADQRGRTYRLCHLPWVASIETGLTKTADKNRFIVLELDALPPGARGGLILPSDDALRDLGVRLLALAVRYLERAKDLFPLLKKQQIKDVDGRLVENYATPAALWAAALGCDRDQAVKVLTEFIDGRVTSRGEIVADEQALVNAIAESRIETIMGERTVAEILGNQHLYADFHPELERSGVALVAEPTRKGRKPLDVSLLPLIFLDTGAVKRFLLTRTDWALKDIDQLLKRLGAMRDERRLAGKVTTGLVLPKEVFRLQTEADQAEQAPSPPQSQTLWAAAQEIVEGVVE